MGPGRGQTAKIPPPPRQVPHSLGARARAATAEPHPRSHWRNGCPRTEPVQPAGQPHSSLRVPRGAGKRGFVALA